MIQSDRDILVGVRVTWVFADLQFLGCVFPWNSLCFISVLTSDICVLTLGSVKTVAQIVGWCAHSQGSSCKVLLL